jgi:hypothetical protein
MTSAGTWRTTLLHRSKIYFGVSANDLPQASWPRVFVVSSILAAIGITLGFVWSLGIGVFIVVFAAIVPVLHLLRGMGSRTPDGDHP